MSNSEIKAIASGALSSVWHTLNRDIKTERPISRNYLVISTHPDDELLIAGIIQRLARETKAPHFVSFTNGNGNTVKPRLPELEKSLKNLGYNGKIDCLMNEREIIDRICIPQDSDVRTVPQGYIDRLSRDINRSINALQQIIEERKADTILVPDYAGGHIAHDITQMAAIIAARRVAKTPSRWIDVLEFPQTFISVNYSTKPKPDELRELLRKAMLGNKEVSIDLKNRIANSSFSIGHLSPGDKPNFSDSQIGMHKGKITLTLPEFTRKIISYLSYKNGTQSESLSRLMSKANNIAEISVEQLRRVPLDREYTQPPNTNLMLYEIVPHRPFARFEAFKRLYESLQKLEKD